MNIKDITEEKFKYIVFSSNSNKEVAYKLGYSYHNGKISKIIYSLCERYNICLDHFDRSLLNRKYLLVKKKCPVCGVEFETQQGHKREKKTCSCKCSNVYFSDARQTKISRIKRSKALMLPSIEIRCFCCGKWFESKRTDRNYCSKVCAYSYRDSKEYRDKLSKAVRKRIANGTHKGWSTRKKCEPSYAEKYTIGILDQLNINHEREMKVGKWFIDFADSKRKLALEIDGKQHNYPERRASDQKKDSYLKANGWKVLRIPWRKIDNGFRIELLCRLYSFFI